MTASGSIINKDKSIIGSLDFRRGGILFRSDGELSPPYEIHLKAGKDIINNGWIVATNALTQADPTPRSLVYLGNDYNDGKITELFDVTTRVSLEAQSIQNQVNGIIGGSNYSAKGTELTLKATAGDIENLGVIHAATLSPKADAMTQLTLTAENGTVRNSAGSYEYIGYNPRRTFRCRQLRNGALASSTSG